MPAPLPSPDLHPFDALVHVMSVLRGPDGCPWDREQSLSTLQAYAVEEVHEVIDAIEGGDPARHREELGDLLLQIVFQSRIRQEAREFDIYDVCRGIVEKMLRRHPHVWGEARADDAMEARQSWERIKADERRTRPHASVLDGVPPALPALLRAFRLAERAARVGFDWPSVAGVRAKIDEELAELDAAIQGTSQEAIEHELGDLLLTVSNLARHLGVEPEQALRRANDRFSRRFRHVEEGLAGEGRTAEGATPEDLDLRWNQAKAAT